MMRHKIKARQKAPRIAPTAIKTVPSGAVECCMKGASLVGGTVAAGYVGIPYPLVRVGRSDGGEPPCVLVGSSVVVVSCSVVEVGSSVVEVVSSVVEDSSSSVVEDSASVELVSSGCSSVVVVDSSSGPASVDVSSLGSSTVLEGSSSSPPVDSAGGGGFGAGGSSSFCENTGLAAMSAVAARAMYRDGR
jgi:hypothetical protein